MTSRGRFRVVLGLFVLLVLGTGTALALRFEAFASRGWSRPGSEVLAFTTDGRAVVRLDSETSDIDVLEVANPFDRWRGPHVRWRAPGNGQTFSRSFLVSGSSPEAVVVERKSEHSHLISFGESATGTVRLLAPFKAHAGSRETDVLLTDCDVRSFSAPETVLWRHAGRAFLSPDGRAIVDASPAEPTERTIRDARTGIARGHFSARHVTEVVFEGETNLIVSTTDEQRTRILDRWRWTASRITRFSTKGNAAEVHKQPDSSDEREAELPVGATAQGLVVTIQKRPRALVTDIRARDTTTWEVRSAWTSSRVMPAVAVSLDGRRLAFTQEDGRIEVVSLP